MSYTLTDGDGNTLTDGDGVPLIVANTLYWIGAGAGSASDDTRWSSTSGGANDVLAPDIADEAIFDGGGLGAGDWNLTEIAYLDLISGYTSIVTMSVDLHVSMDLTIVSDVGQDFITDGNDLRVSGNYHATGSGAGITHSAGGTIYWSGDVYHQVGLLLSPVVIDGGLLTPTNAKTHLIEIPSNNPRPYLLTIGENQHVQISNKDIKCGEVTLNANTVVEGLGPGSSIIIFDALINPHNCTWFGPTANDLSVVLTTSSIAPADYGNARVLLQETTTVLGAYITTGDFHFGSNGNTQTYLMFGTVTASEVVVGGSFPSRAANLVQKSGSRITASSDLIVRSDDGAQENLWVREAGSLDTVIGGNLNVQTLAGIDWSADIGVCEVFGGVAVHSSAVCDFGFSTIKHYAGIENPTPINEFYNVITNVSNNTAMPTGAVQISGGWSFEGTGDFNWNNNDVTMQGLAGNILAGAGNVNFIYTAGSLLTISLINTVNGGISYLEGADYNVEMLIRPRDVGGANTVVILGDVGLGAGDLLFNNHGLDLNWFTFSCARVDDFFGWYTIDLNGGHLNASGDIQMDLATSSIIGSGSITCTDFKQSSVSSFNATGKTVTISGNHELPLGGVFNLGNGTIEVFGDFIPLGDVNLGSGTYICQGVFDLLNANSVASSGATIIRRGAADAVFNLGGLTDVTVIMNMADGGICRLTQIFSITGEFREIAAGSAVVEWQSSGSYQCDQIVTVGSSGKKTSNVSSGGPTYNITVSQLGPVNRYSGWANCDIVGAYIRVDLLTSSNDGGNDVVAPNGIDFGNYPPDTAPAPTGVGRRRGILGRGLHLGRELHSKD